MQTAEDKNGMPELKRVISIETRNYLNGLRIYFTKESNEGSPIAALIAYSDFVEMQAQLK